MGDGRECKEGWFSSRRRELLRKVSALVSVLPRWAGPEWLCPAHQPDRTFPQLYVRWRHMASLKPAVMGEWTAWKLANPAPGPPLYEDPQIPESGESLQERPSGGNVGAPPKGEPRLCIQAGSEGSHTKKLSCRGQKRDRDAGGPGVSLLRRGQTPGQHGPRVGGVPADRSRCGQSQAQARRA